MHIETKKKLSKFINNFLAFFKVVICLILALLVLTLAAQLMGFENHMPFYDRLNDFFTNSSSIFYTPTKDSDEDFNGLVYTSIALVFFVLIFDSITDIATEILKAYDQNNEDVLARENAKVNDQIQHKYQMHLQTSMRFIITLELAVNHPLLKTQAFKDEKMEQAIKLQSENILKEVTATILNSTKCKILSHENTLIFEAKDIPQLNNLILLIHSICEVGKYVKNGLEYYAAVTAYDVNDTNEEAISDAKKLMELRSCKKILCYQIVSECLKLLPDANFKGVNNGEYSDCENSVFELVYKI